MEKTEKLLAKELIRRGIVDEELMNRITTYLQAQATPPTLLEYLESSAQNGRVAENVVALAKDLSDALRFAVSEEKPRSARLNELPALSATDLESEVKEGPEKDENEALGDLEDALNTPDAPASPAAPGEETRSASGSGVHRPKRRRKSSARLNKHGSGIRRGAKKGRRRSGSRRVPNLSAEAPETEVEKAADPTEFGSAADIDLKSLPNPEERGGKLKRASGSKRRSSTASMKRVASLPKKSDLGLPLPMLASIGGVILLLLIVLIAIPKGASSDSPRTARKSSKRVRSGRLVSDVQGGSKKRRKDKKGAEDSPRVGGNSLGLYKEVFAQAESGDYVGALKALQKFPANASRAQAKEDLFVSQAQAVRSGIEIAEAQARRGEFIQARESLKRCRRLGGERFKAAVEQKLADLVLLTAEGKKADALGALVEKGRAKEVWERLKGMATSDGPLLQLKKQVAEILLRQLLAPIYQKARSGQLEDALEALAKLRDGDPALSYDEFQIHSARIRRRWGALAGAPRRNPGNPEKGPVGATAVRKQRRTPATYKDDFHELQEAVKRTKSSELGALETEFLKVMQRSEALLESSPEMAYDVCRFYHGRRSFIRKHAVLSGLLDIHNKKAFDVILPTVTGPAGFRRLAEFCRKVNYKEGKKTLAPLLARVSSAFPSNPLARGQRDARQRWMKNRRELNGFVRRGKQQVIEQLRGLLAWIKANGYQSEEVKKSFPDLVDRLCRQLCKDSKLTAELLAEFRELNSRDLSESQASVLKSEFAKRKKRLIDSLEDRFLKAVKQALSAKEPAFAFDLLRQALIVKPGSARIYRGLLYKKVDGEWIRPWDAQKRLSGLRDDVDIGWHRGAKKPGRYYDETSKIWRDLAKAEKRHSSAADPWRFQSEHFDLASSTSLSESLKCKRRLEAFYLQIFRQLDRYFAPNGNARKVFGLAKGARHKVRYYRDRDQYLAHGKPPAQWSAGFWESGRRSSFFYLIPGQWVVLQHEIVHQILGENASGHAEAWLAEGIAVYLENAEFNESGQLVLGSLDQHRRPYSYHLQAVQGSVSIGFKEVLALKTMQQWSSGTILDHYMGAGALVYFFMKMDGGAYRNSFLDYLRSCYNGGSHGALEAQMDLNASSLEWLFNRFYRQGFCVYRGKTMTWDERAVFDRDEIARVYPDPKVTARNAEKSKPGLSQFDKRRRDLKSSKYSTRREAFQSLFDEGEEGQTLLKSEIPRLFSMMKSSLMAAPKKQRGSLLQVLTAEALKRRKSAYNFIMDPKKYPSANHGRVAQPEVDKRVAALKACYDDPWSVLVGKSRKLTSYQTRLRDYFDWSQQLKLEPENYQALIKELKLKFATELNLRRLGLDGADRALRKSNSLILEANKANVAGMSEEEVDACLATNEYRMLFGLRALKHSGGLARAARAHSDEMKRLNYFSHESPTPENRTPAMRCQKQGARMIAENIANGHSTGRSAIQGWLNSSGHHRNILSKSAPAIGLGQSGSLWTQVFGAGA